MVYSFGNEHIWYVCLDVHVVIGGEEEGERRGLVYKRKFLK